MMRKRSRLLFMAVGFGRKGEVKDCTPGRVGGGPYASAMRFDDGAADPESHASPLRFGGEKCVEDLLGLLRWESHACIAHRHHELAVFGLLRTDGQLARPLHIPHRVNAVNDEVHQYLLQLQSIPYGI